PRAAQPKSGFRFRTMIFQADSCRLGCRPPSRAASRPPQSDGEHARKSAVGRQPACRRRADVVRGCLSRSAPLLAQLRPVFEMLSDLALEAALRRIVELTAAERFREIILPR